MCRRAISRAFVRIGLEHHRLFRCEQRVGTERFAGDDRVLDGHEVRVRTESTLCRQLQHLRTECREDTLAAAIGGRAAEVQAAIHRIEVASPWSLYGLS